MKATCVLKKEDEGEFWPKIGDSENNAYASGSKKCNYPMA